jgi:hypothetical protein
VLSSAATSLDGLFEQPAGMIPVVPHVRRLEVLAYQHDFPQPAIPFH